MFHVTDTIATSVSLAIDTTLMFVLPSNAVMMLRSIYSKSSLIRGTSCNSCTQVDSIKFYLAK